MNPMLKYTLARIGLFVAVAAVLVVIPVPLHILIKLAVAVVISAVLALFLLKGMRDDVAHQLAGAQQRRAAEKERLRSALGGDEQTGGEDKDSDP